MKIPIAKPYLTEDEAQNAYNTILSGWVTQGPRVEEFEEIFAFAIAFILTDVLFFWFYVFL